MLSARVMKNWLPQPPSNPGAIAIDTVPFEVCFKCGTSSGAKYRGTLGVGGSDFDAMYDKADSPPVPVAVGSPTCATKSFVTRKQPD